MHKKVGTIRLPVKQPDGTTVYKDYQAEFNDAFINGDISFLNGTFAGTLTTQAVNAVKNITIAGHNVARTLVLKQSGSIHAGQDSWTTLISGAINVPSGLSSNIILNVMAQMKLSVTDYNHGDERLKPFKLRVLVNGVQVDYSESNAGQVIVISPYLSYEFLVPGQAGNNQVEVQLYMPGAGHNIGFQTSERTMRLDAILK